MVEKRARCIMCVVKVMGYWIKFRKQFWEKVLKERGL